LKKGSIILLLSLCLSSAAFGIQVGWKDFGGYYKPFVTVKEPKDKIVLFVTPDGKVFKGRCRRRAKEKCSIYPGKRFPGSLPIRYIILKIPGFSPPEVVGTGVIR